MGGGGAGELDQVKTALKEMIQETLFKLVKDKFKKNLNLIL
jgi:hypothetical protein